MGWKSMQSRLIAIWYQMNLRRKLYVIIGSVGIIMAASIFLNIKVAYIFIDNVSAIMDDNLACYKFQEAMGNETKRFARLLADRTLENEEAYKAAAGETRAYLNSLPYDYEKIGERRYAITWNILNGYSTYETQRDKVLGMETDEPGYIKELYKVYNMQSYLDSYGARLTKAVMTGGNDYYEAQLPILRRMPYVLIVISLAAFAVLLVSLRFFTGTLVKTLVQLSTVSRQIEVNDFSAPDVSWEGTDEIGRMVGAFNKMRRATQQYVATAEAKQQMEEQLHRQELERATLEQRFSMAQLQLLKSQLNPHFLFNTLNMITRMSQMEEAPVTEEMLVAMSNLLRYSLRTTNPFAPLEQELKVVRDYMYIQQMRFGDRVRWKIECSPDLYSREVPVFLFQPLAENAMIHGISQKENGGAVYIRVKQRGDRMRISIADTGRGMSQETLAGIREAARTKGTGLGIGLGNIYRRITSYYENGTVTIHSKENCGTVVQMEFGEMKSEG